MYARRGYEIVIPGAKWKKPLFMNDQRIAVDCLSSRKACERVRPGGVMPLIDEHYCV